MIVVKRKKTAEIERMLSGKTDILIVDSLEYNTDTRLDAKELKEKLRKKDFKTTTHTLKKNTREEIKQIPETATILALTDGATTQIIAEEKPTTQVLPGADTLHLGTTEKKLCIACGDCLLDKTAGICPIARCPKNMLNGPCGGQVDGRCEVSGPCAWIQIYGRLKSRKKMEALWELQKPR